MSFFEQSPPPELDVRVLRAANTALAENRAGLKRRRFMQWFMVPAFSTAAVLLVLRMRQTEAPNVQLADFAEWSDVDEMELAAIDDLEIIEDLDVLEDWEDA